MEKLLKIPYTVFNNDWDLLQQFLERRGNPRYELVGNIDLRFRDDIIDLGNLIRVDGFMNLEDSSIESLGSLEYVSGYLYLYSTPIESLGNLLRIDNSLDIRGTTFETLGNLKYIGNSLYMQSAELQSFGDLEYVGGKIILTTNHQIPEEQLNKFKFRYW